MASRATASRLGLLMVAAQDVASSAHGHCLGLVVDLVAALGDGQRHARRGVGEHDIAHHLVGALAGAEQIQQLALLERRHRLGADHAAVGDHADPADREAPAQPVDHRDQRGDVGDIARPHLGAHRPRVAIDQDRQDHLGEVRAMVLAVAVAAEGLPAGAFEVETGGVHEHQVEPAEQIAPMGEQPLLDQVLGAARGERRARVLLRLRQLLAEPRHRPVEMLQLQRLGAGDPVVLAPAIGRQVRAATHQPVQNGEEDRPLEREPVLALLGHVLDHRPAAGLGPQALEHQGRPDPPHRRRRVVLRRAQHHRVRREARPRAHQPLQLAARRERVQAAEGGDHPLADLATHPPALGDLEIDPSA